LRATAMKVRLKDSCYMKKETYALWGKVLIVTAALLCLFMSSAITLSGLEAGNYGGGDILDWFNFKLLLLFEGTLGILASALSLTSEVFALRKRHYFLSIIGSCFVMFQGLHILEFGAITNGWHIVFAFGVPVSILSMLSLVFVFLSRADNKSI
jgi:hypothetical protein